MYQGDYIPSAPISDEVKERNQNLPGMGGVYNYVNLHVYHYGANNPIKYVDPDGEIIIPIIIATAATATAVVAFVVTNMPSKDEHYNRNQYNQMTDATGNNISSLEQAKSVGYNRLGIEKGEKNANNMAKYHRQGTGSPDPDKNQKFVLPNETGIGSSELIFNERGELVTDSINKGTYNFADAEKNPIMHGIKDILPYIIYGNDEVDKNTTTWFQRATGTYKGPIPE
jgi:hypothetical protein